MYLKCIILVLLTLLLLALNLRCDCPPTIRQTTNGPIEGTIKTSILGQKYYAFEGVRYAAPPITGIDPITGKQVDRRFKAPEPLTYQWTEPLKAQDPSITCMPSEVPPIGYPTLNFTEDCLVLSIFVPADGADLKSVIVQMHGSGTAGGTTLNKVFGPDFLLYQDNIVVMPEFRIQMYGFLNLNLRDYTGNMGLKDQQEALKWINRNIKNFSGNKNQILLFGQSWGASHAHLQMLNKVSRPLVTRAFYLSGTGLNPAFYPWSNRVNQLQQMKTCYNINDTDTLINYLKTANSSTFNSCIAPVWIPVVENPKAPKPFLTDTPENIIKSCNAPAMDTLFSFTSTEAAAPLPAVTKSTVPLIMGNWNASTFITPWVDFTKTAYPNEYKAIVEKLKIYYTPNSTDAATIINRNLAMVSNTYLVNAILMTTIYQTQANTKDDDNCKKTFLLRFSTRTDLNLYSTVYHLNYSGATHAEDAFYDFLFSPLLTFNLYQQHLQAKDAVYDYIMRSVKLITNFARTGDPTIDSNTTFKSCKSPEKFYCTEISNDAVSPITTNILDELYYQTWLDIFNIYKNIKRTH